MPRKKIYKNKRMKAYVDGKTALLYVKLPAYIRVWYAAMYGSPVMLRDDHAAIPVMCMSIRPTDRMAYNDTSSMSEELWKVAIQDPSFEKSEWLAFVLPESVIRNDVEVKVDGRWDLYYTDIRRFKSELDREFWRAVMMYICDMQVQCRKDGVEFRMDWTLQRFCAENGIMTEYYDQVRRQYYRKLESSRYEPAEIRELMLKSRDANLKSIDEGVRFQMLRFLDAE